MTLETAIGYLLALAVPLWLVIEAALNERSSRRRSEDNAVAGRAPGAPAPGGAPTVERSTGRTMHERASRVLRAPAP